MIIHQAEDGTKFGWRSSVDGTHYLKLEDYEQNGRFCKSGLAYESKKDTATCVSATNVVS